MSGKVEQAKEMKRWRQARERALLRQWGTLNGVQLWGLVRWERHDMDAAGGHTMPLRDTFDGRGVSLQGMAQD